MRQVTVRENVVSVTNDPHRVLTQLLSCLRDEPNARTLEGSFAPGGAGFSVPNVVDARPTPEPPTPYRSPEGDAEPWTVTMHRAKGPPRTVVLQGDELRHLVNTTLAPALSARGLRNRWEAAFLFGTSAVVFVACTLLFRQVAGWELSVPVGLMMGGAVLFRLWTRIARRA